jgi:hypothetical protein
MELFHLSMPSWVIFDNSNSKISGTAPLVAQTTNYTFYIKSTWTDSFLINVQKSITIQVVNVEVTEVEIPATVAGAVAVASTQAALAVGTSFTLVSSSLSKSSPTAVWSLINQLQMITLLMLIDSSTPEDFTDYQEGVSFVNFNFDFLPSKNVPYVNWPSDALDVELNDRKLNASGLVSRSTFVNLFSTIIVLLIILLIHTVFLLLPFHEPTPIRRTSKIYKCVAVVRTKVLKFFKYSLYIRLGLECHQLLLLSSTVELQFLDFSEFSSVISLILAAFGLILGIGLAGIAVIVFIKERRNHNPDRKFILMEMIADIKDTKWARLYTSMLLGRRTIFILVIIFITGEIHRTVIYLFLAGIQLFYFLFIVSLHCFNLFRSSYAHSVKSSRT